MAEWVWLLAAALAGAAAALLVPAALLLYYLSPVDEGRRREEPVPLTLPPEVAAALARGAGGPAEGALNAALQFVFQQSTADTRWLRRRLAAELADLLTKTSSGRIFESLTLRSLEVGSEFPSVANLRLLGGELEEGGARLRGLDLAFDLTYDGNFRIDVDAVMLLGKIANISITVESVSGALRAMFRRSPYTHWALAFESPPRLELGVRGRFQGRQLRPRLAAMVAAHIRRAVAQRHTLPNYKIRYKPFFPKSDPGSWAGEEAPTPCGRLSVRLLETTRLRPPPAAAAAAAPADALAVRCSLAVDSHGWVSLRRNVLVLDVALAAAAGPLGLVCVQAAGAVSVDTVVPMSPAYRADLRRGDVVLAIDNKPVSNVAQVGKLLRAIERRAVTVRIRRGGGGGGEGRRARGNFSFRRVSEVMEGVRMQGMRAAASKTSLHETDSPSKGEPRAEPEAEAARRAERARPEPAAPGFGLRKRRCSVENKSSDSSAGSTPPASGASTPLKQATKPDKPEPLRRPDIPTIRTDSSECRADDEDEAGGGARHEHVEICQMHWTRSAPLRPIVAFDEEAEFKLNENHKYLNVNVWAAAAGAGGAGAGGGAAEEALLGYLNIPLAVLLAESRDSTVAHHTKRFQFLPPDVDIKFSKTHPLSSHAGFEPCLCFGDALLWWEWEPAGPRAARAPPAPAAPAAATAAPAAAAAPAAGPARAHDFVRTHFHRSTHCDFCNKKIWLKDALQCRDCGLCCHKKCVAKCQETSPCAPDHEGAARGPPELVTTPPAAAEPDSDDDDRKDSLDVQEEGGAMSALVAGLRRAGSAHSLCAPRAAAASRSLPPSPSHTPRKQSLEAGGNPFSHTGASWLQAAAVGPLLRPALRSALPPDALLAAARDAAPDLAAALSRAQIDDMLAAVREELSSDPAGVAGVEGVAGGGGDARACALTALMLHCCAAAQLAQRPPA